uniref:Uncharacterized protein n=1 Tax=Yersinia enterocolitica TaxID=630 RepID=B0RL25_YEREN|nr:hypothetical protein [Yersinia enterocolitica]
MMTLINIKNSDANDQKSLLIDLQNHPIYTVYFPCLKNSLNMWLLSNYTLSLYSHP